MVNILGDITMIASLTVIVFGLIEQAEKNYKNKSTEGLAHSLVYSICATYTLWAIYSWVKPDYFLAITQTVGVAISYVLLFQVFYYNKHYIEEKTNETS